MGMSKMRPWLVILSLYHVQHLLYCIVVMHP